MQREQRAESKHFSIHNILRMLCAFVLIGFCGLSARGDGLFFEDEPIQSGLRVRDVSNTFAEIYEKLDSVNFGGKNINVAIESLENLNRHAHIAATDERVVLVWDDAIVANYPRPGARDWNAFGEITTALILQMRARDANLAQASESEMYKLTVDALMRGIDENGRYIFSKRAAVAEDGRLLTALGLSGVRDARGNFRVTGVYKGSSADAAGIRADDLVSAINGKNISEISDAELDAILAGFNSGTAKLKLMAPSGNRDVVLRRATIVSADADVVYRDGAADGGILEIVIHTVSDGAVSIVNEALNKYPDVHGVILDMRAATGDDARSAAKMAGLFVGAVPVMRIVETAKQEVEIVPGGDAITRAPVVVVVSDTTRGTPEAIARAIYDNARGVIIGTPTSGAGRIATMLDLSNGGALELLNKIIKSGNGATLDGRGVFPIVCLANIRTASQQNAFFLNVINNDFNVMDFNRDTQTPVASIRRGCPTITSGTDEDALVDAVSAKLLTDKSLYNKLLLAQE